MKVSDSCGNGPLSTVQNNRFGANFVSPLQKASHREHAVQSHSWMEQCYEVLVSPPHQDASLSLPIDGGSDAGMFCVIGSHVDRSRLVYYNTGSTNATSGVVGDRNETPRQLQPGDIILALNEYEISGYTRRDAVELCDTLTRVPVGGSSTRPRLRIRLSPPQALATGSTMLSSFLAAAFPLNSPEYALQEKIRENVYQRVVPCTTRLPRADEVDGIHYRFMSVPQFLALERSGQLLESGMYKGNHYGTPRPDPNATALDSLINNHLSVSSSSSAQLTDDSCPIPPPLPPLASLSNVMGSLSTPSESSSSSTGGSQQTLPPATAVPPPPPVRYSSITTQSITPRERLPSTQDRTPNGLNKESVATTHPSTTNHNRMNSIDLGPLSDRYDKLTSQLGNNSYLIDCDLSGSQWKDSGVYVASCSNTASITNGLQSVLPPDPTGSDLNTPSSSLDRDLPYGWEVVQDPKYGIFYIDHINKRTQYEPPTEEDFVHAAAVRSQLWSVAGSIPTTGGACPVVSDASTSTNGTLVTRRPDPSSKEGRITPTTFTTDPKQIKGPIVTTTLVKSPRGFGFTVVGGADCNRLGYLQIKHLVPGGPASVNSCLDVGDVLVVVNSINVLGYTHAEIVSLFQSIPVGASITLTVSQAYRLRRETNETTPACSAIPSSGSSTSQVTRLSVCANSSGPTVSPTGRSDSPVHSASSHTASPHLSLSPPSSSLVGTKSHELSNSSPEAVAIQVNPRSRPTGQRPEFLKVAIFKQPNGFGFTLADHPQGQHVKAILDPARCGRLRVGDVVVEINDQRVKEISHAEVVQILKQCPVGQEARLLVQRGGLYTSPLSLLNPEHVPLNHSSVLGEKISPSPMDFGTTSQAINGMDPKAMYAISPPQAHNAVHLRTGSSTVPTISIDSYSTPTDEKRHRTRTPSVEVDRRTGPNDLTYAELSEFGAFRPPTSQPQQQLISDRRRRMQPSDDSALLAMGKPLEVPANGPTSPDSTLHYGSLLRPGRMPPLRHSDSVQTDAKAPDSGAPRAPSFLMLPGEFLVHLQRQANGFGFTVVGGAEENSQITVGSLIPGGSAQMSGVVRTGDRLISINGYRVVGFKHREVVQLLDQAAHTVGQVTLGLQRPPPECPTYEPTLRDAVEVVVPRSPKNDGYGFFISNTHPRMMCNGTGNDANSQNVHSEGEYIAQLVPGSKAERLGLLSVGDRILAVNKIPVAGMHHDQVVRLIRESGSHIVLTIIPSPASPWASRFQTVPDTHGTAVEFPVTLFRGSRGFGFSIRGGQEFNKMPLLVLRIADGGAAQMDGRLRVGDELIEINGYPTVGMSHGRAIEIIQAGGNTMQLIVRRRTAQSGKSVDLTDRTRNQQHRSSLFRQFASTRIPPQSSVQSGSSKPHSPHMSRLNWLGLVKKTPGSNSGRTTDLSSHTERRNSANLEKRVPTTSTSLV